LITEAAATVAALIYSGARASDEVYMDLSNRLSSIVSAYMGVRSGEEEEQRWPRVRHRIELSTSHLE